MATTLPKRRRTRHSRAVIGLITTFTGVYLLDAVLNLQLAPTLALVPQELLAGLQLLQTSPGNPSAWKSVLTVFSSVFVHSDVMHLGFNMLYFWFFGSLLAKVAGDRWVVLALLLCSASSGAAFVIAHADGPAAGVVGASGAISGIAGLYVLLAFRWEIPDASAWPLARPVPPIQAAALAIGMTVLDVWVLSESAGDGVARDAHIGGFAGGLFLGMVMTTAFPTWVDYRRSRWSPSYMGRTGDDR